MVALAVRARSTVSTTARTTLPCMEGLLGNTSQKPILLWKPLLKVSHSASFLVDDSLDMVPF